MEDEEIGRKCLAGTWKKRYGRIVAFGTERIPRVLVALLDGFDNVIGVRWFDNEEVELINA